MKKYFLTLISAMSLSLTAHAGIDLGVTAGYNLTNASFNAKTASNILSGKNGSGWYIGPKVNLGLVMGFSVDAAAVFNQREFKFTTTAPATKSEKSRSIDLPVNLKYSFSLAGTGVYVTTGPQFSFAVGNKEWNVRAPEAYVTEVVRTENLTTTWNIGAGVRLLSRLEVGVGYNVALGKTGENMLRRVGVNPGTTELKDYKLNTFNLNATVYF